MQHLQNLGRLQFHEPTFEVMVRTGACVETFYPSLSLQQDLDGLLDLIDLRIGLEARISHASEQMAATRVASNEEKAHTARAGVGAQDFGELVRVYERQFDLRDYDLGRVGKRDFETGSAMRRHLAGISRNLECVCNALASASIPVCDEDHFGRHVDFVGPPIPR
jgi:hypothetical protein